MRMGRPCPRQSRSNVSLETSSLIVGKFRVDASISIRFALI